MPEIEISVGGRSFEVACQAGEEHYLEAAARILDSEASVLADQIGRLPEARMLLMAGLMLADKTAGLEDKLRDLQQELDGMRAAGPQRIEVPVVPDEVTQTLAELAARAESLAAEVEALQEELAALKLFVSETVANRRTPSRANRDRVGLSDEEDEVEV